MSKTVLVALSVLVAISSSCNYDAQVAAYLSAKAEMVQSVLKTVEANPTVGGVEEAQRVFESKKADLIAKKEMAKKALPKSGNGLQMLYESKGTYEKVFADFSERVRPKFDADPAAREKFKTLMQSYYELFPTSENY